jgi:hypothetical protein
VNGGTATTSWREAEKERACVSHLGVIVDQVCRLIRQRSDPAVVTAQGEPSNQTVVHPRLG